MVRIAGIELPDDKRIDFALTQIYGIGWKLASKILAEAKVPAERRTKELTAKEMAKLSQLVESYPVEGDLRGYIRENIARLKAIGAYRGIRHARNLPVRGQRTRTNARTKRGARKTVGAFKKEVLAKMTAGKTKAESE